MQGGVDGPPRHKVVGRESLRTAAARSSSLLMRDVLGEAPAPSRGATRELRSKAKSGGAFTKSGMQFWSFVFSLCLSFVGADSVFSSLAVAPYFASTAAVRKCVVSPARPHEIALSELLDSTPVAELQHFLRRGEEATGVLAERKMCLASSPMILSPRRKQMRPSEVKWSTSRSSWWRIKMVSTAAKNELSATKGELETFRAEN